MLLKDPETECKKKKKNKYIFNKWHGQTERGK